MSSAAREKLYGVVVFVVVFVGVVGYGRLATWRAQQAAVAEREAQIERVTPTTQPKPTQEGDEDMGYFGNKGSGGFGNGIEDTMILASLFPAGGGAAIRTDAWGGSSSPLWPTWPAGLGDVATEYGDANLSIWATYNESNQVTSAQAYIWIDPAPGLVSASVVVAVYNSAKEFLGSSQVVALTPGDPAWVDFSFSSPVAIDPEEDYYLCIWTDSPTWMFPMYVMMGDYSGPVKISVSNVVEVASAGVVFEINTTVKTVRDVVVAADKPIGLKRFVTINDQVSLSEGDKPLMVSPCWGRYIELETMLGISTPRQVSSEGTVTPPDPLPPDDTEETPETEPPTLLIEGFGENALGGTGGPVYMVTSLDDYAGCESVEGTFRWALAQDSPKIVRFGVQGIIALANAGTQNAAWDVPEYTTVEGSTAPGRGVCLQGQLRLHSHTILTYLRIRPGTLAYSDAVQVWRDAHDLAIDHCSITWSNDEAIGFDSPTDSSVADARNVTIQWCLLAECDKNALIWKSSRVTLHHNLIMRAETRNPMFSGYFHAAPLTAKAICDFRNNWVFDTAEFPFGINGDVGVNCVGNYFRYGLESRKFTYSVWIEASDYEDESKVYMDGNMGPHMEDDGDDEWAEVNYEGAAADEGTHRALVAFDAPTITAETDYATAKAAILAGVGASLPERDPVDVRLVADAENETNVGTYPRSAAACRTLATTYYAGELDAWYA